MRQKGGRMLTLKELRSMVEPAETQVRVPTVKKQQEMQVVVKEIIDAHTEIVVYKNGYVIYRVGKRATVFPLHSCDDYIYDSGVTDIHKLKSDFFENESWYVRLILEGEDRLIHNQDTRIEAKSISYSAVSEEWDVLAEDDKMLEKLIIKEQVKEVLSEMTEKQRYAVKRYYLDEISQKEIATELSVSSSAVSSIIRKAVQRVRRRSE